MGDTVTGPTAISVTTTVSAWMQVQQALDDRLAGLKAHRAKTDDGFVLSVIDSAIRDIERARAALDDMLYARTRLEVGIALFEGLGEPDVTPAPDAWDRITEAVR